MRLQKQVTERKLADELPSMLSELLVSMSAGSLWAVRLERPTLWTIVRVLSDKRLQLPERSQERQAVVALLLGRAEAGSL